MYVNNVIYQMGDDPTIKLEFLSGRYHQHLPQNSIKNDHNLLFSKGWGQEILKYLVHACVSVHPVLHKRLYFICL